ncbi:hypothetical protein BJ973_008042 [Actinoplanes tereljensis]|uniref:Uncharacterized protein n=1 Tax=Paractinoplanes tereljensis TaxID=571912 RepID=A0A919NTT4_9ACTN|nr:hypothetical protein [Actinoplanes tereljensis]GIF24563.1 hypothetical protein Ate02nite_72930 [Actinoplanes tereljensis]
MTGEPVLTSGWCTNWGAFNTPRLWSMVMNEDDGPGRTQVSAWRTLAGSVRSQRAALLTARADLAAAWPPDENESAAAFLDELDILIKRLDLASADADTTASGLDNILNALQTAKSEIQPLWEQYKDKSDDLVPRWWDGAEDEIDEKARAAMITAERTVEDAVAQLKVPEKYELIIEGERSAVVQPGQPDQPKGGSGIDRGLNVTVPHDPVPPLPGQDPTLPDDPSGSDAADPVGGGGSGPGAGGVGSGGGTGVSTGGGGGPDLAGVITPGQPPVVPGTGPSIGLPGGGGGGPLPSTGGNPLLPGLLPTGGGGPITPSGGRSARSGPRPSGATIGEAATGRGGTGGGIGGRGASGGLGGRGISGGGAGGRGLPGGGARGGAGARGRTSGRVGGLGVEGEGIRGARGGSRSGGVPRPAWLSDDEVGPNRRTGAGVGAGAAGSPGAPGRANRRARGDDDTVGFDPDNPWEVAEGVAPVIRPSTEEPRHDPGPNVIGRRG